MEKVRILIVEDDNSLREVLAELMSEQGYEVEAVSSGEQALKKAMEVAFDLVVTDIRMEGMSGLEALEQMKQHQPDIGSLVVTGYSTEADSIRAIRLGVGEYLKKPFDLSDFIGAVETLLEKRRQAIALSNKERTSERLIGWAVKTLNRVFDGELESNQTQNWTLGALEASELAITVADEMELSQSILEQVGNAVLYLALDKRLELDSLEFPNEALTPATRRIISLVEQPEDQELPMSARIAQAALALLTGEQDKADPQLWERLQTAKEVTETQEGNPATNQDQELGRQRRGLLSLARALEGGRPEGAREAYSKVLEQPGHSREGVEAYVGLARLAQRAGDKATAQSHCETAVEAAAQVGPVTLAWSTLRAGLLIVLENESLGQSWIRTADKTMGELRIASGKALTSLALQAYAGEGTNKLAASIQTLLSPENLPDLAENGYWLIPYFLELSTNNEDELLERILAKLARECTRQFQFQLQRNSEPKARLAGVQALAIAGGQVAEEALSELTRDPDPQVRQAANRALEERKGANPLPLLRIFTLGAFEVYLGDTRLDGKWRGKQLSYLLAFLSIQAERGVTEDVVVDAFWPKDALKGKKNLSSAISHLRKHLRSPDGKEDYLVRNQMGLRLNPNTPRWHDTEELDKLCDAVKEHAKAGRKQKALECGGQITRLYRGPFLEGCYMEWAVLTRDRLERSVAEALRMLAQFTLELERYQETAEYARQVLELDPCSQEGHLALMKAHLGLGRPEEAVRQYERCQTKLARELDMEPSIAILETYQRARLSI